RRALVRSWRIDSGRANGPAPLNISSYTLREGQVCLAPDRPLVLDLPASAGPGSLVLVAHPGADASAWRVALGGELAATSPIGPGPARARDTLNPIPFTHQPTHIKL